MKVLIIQLRQLGDVLLSSPLARVIKEEVPDSEVHFLTSESARELLEGNPYIDRILTIGKGILSELKTIRAVREEGYDAVIDAQRTGRSKRITLLSGAEKRVAFRKKGENFYYNTLVDWVNRGYTAWERMELLRGIGIEEPVRKYLPEIFPSEEDESAAETALRELGIGDFFLVVPTSRRLDRAWAPEKFGRLSSMIAERTGLTPLIAYGPGEEKVARRALTGKARILRKPLPLRSFASLVDRSSFFIGNDSLSSHIAVSRGKRSVVVLGPNEGWFPDLDFVVKVRKGLPCQPCGNWKECRKDLACFRQLSPEEVIERMGFL